MNTIDSNIPNDYPIIETDLLNKDQKKIKYKNLSAPNCNLPRAFLFIENFIIWGLISCY